MVILWRGTFVVYILFLYRLTCFDRVTATMALDWQNEDEVKEYLENLSVEYRFQCYHEKRPDGCHRLGDFLEAVRKEYGTAARVYKRNCEENKYGKSCFKYGTFNFLGKGIENENRVSAFEYFQKACKNGTAEGCFHAGLQLISKNDNSIPKNYPLGLELLEKACSENYALGCYFASGIYMTGAPGIPKDLKKSFIHSYKACELDNIYACANLSQMYTRGEGVEKDLELGAKYKAKALDIQDQIKNKHNAIQFEQGT